MQAYLVHVSTFSGLVFPQIWFDPPPRGYSEIKPIGGVMTPITFDITGMSLKQIEARVLRHHQQEAA